MRINKQYTWLLLTFAATSGFAQEVPTKNNLSIEVIEVTARKKVESLHDVPDSVTAFNASEITSARIDNVNDFANLTPNLVIRQGFRAGVSYITMRGITTSQQGLPPVTFVVDGVQAGAMDFVNQDLNNIERIEILRGPQGALYGAGAMAGAINIITKAPEEEWSGSAKLQFAEGNDKSAKLSASGGINDNLFVMVNGNFRKSDGLIDSAQGENLDFNDSKQFSTRWQYINNQFSADFRLAYSNYDQGAIMQDLVAAPVDNVSSVNLDDFSGAGPERSFVGREKRKFNLATLKLDYEFDLVDLTWISSKQKVDQHLLGDLDWSAAPIFLQDLTDNFEVKSHEIRLSSNKNKSYNWLVGAYYQERDALNDLTIRLEPEKGVVGSGIFSQIDVKNDKISAVFAQVSADITDKLELTLAARYDSVKYQTTRFTDRTLNVVAPLLNKQGDLQDTQISKDTSFQPKVSLSYDVTPELMVYSTISKGFRPGFYNSGNLTKAEKTKNYELGFKSTVLKGRGQINSALFYIDYSDQQLSSIITEPPFRVTTNIPNTKIKGLEFEAIYMLSEDLRFTFGYGYTNAEVQVLNVQAPTTPKNTLNLGLLHQTELVNSWLLESRIDYRFQGKMSLGTLDLPLYISNKNYVNISSSITNEHWRATLYVDNLTDEYTATEASYVNGLLGVVTGVIRAYTPGRQIGASITYSF